MSVVTAINSKLNKKSLFNSLITDKLILNYQIYNINKNY